MKQRLMAVLVGGLFVIFLLSLWHKWPWVIGAREVMPEPQARERYVVMPHPADRETRRRAAYLARLHDLALVADSNATDVRIEEYSK